MDEVQAEMEQFERDIAYYQAQRETLLQQYPETWVAIYNQQVVGAAKDLKRLIHQLEKRGIPKCRPFVEYVTEKEELLIL